MMKDPAVLRHLQKYPKTKKLYLDLSLPRLLLSRIKKMSLQEFTRLPNTFRWTDCISVRNAALPPARIGNKLTEEEQWDKLRLVKEIAEEVWGK